MPTKQPKLRRIQYRDPFWVWFCATFALAHVVLFFVVVYTSNSVWYLWYNGAMVTLWTYLTTIENDRPRPPDKN